MGPELLQVNPIVQPQTRQSSSSARFSLLLVQLHVLMLMLVLIALFMAFWLCC